MSDIGSGATIDDLLKEIRALKDRVATLERGPIWTRVKSTAVVVAQGLRLIRAVDNVYTFAFDAPRTDANYGVETHVHHIDFWRTWGRATNLTTQGFDVHLLNEANQKIGISQYNPEVTVLVVSNGWV